MKTFNFVYKTTFNNGLWYIGQHTTDILEETIKFSADNQTYAFYPKYYDKLPFGCHTRKTRLRLYDIFKLDNGGN